MTPEEIEELETAPGGIRWYTHYYRVSAENDALRIEQKKQREEIARLKAARAPTLCSERLPEIGQMVWGDWENDDGRRVIENAMVIVMGRIWATCEHCAYHPVADPHAPTRWWPTWKPKIEEGEA